MNTARQGGFIKHLTFFVVAACVLFIVFAALAKYVGPGAAGNLSSLTNGSYAAPGGGSSAPASGNNSLLGFLNDTSGSSYGSSGTYGQTADLSNIAVALRSPYAGMVTLGTGNAPSSYQPSDEYVTLSNGGQSSIDITGWKLGNSKGTRPVQTSGNNYVYPSAETATIGQGTGFLDPSDIFRTGDIVLKPGDTAIVTTGGPFVSYPYKISTSFRENECDGYLRNYPFDPQLNQNCPAPTADPSIHTVTQECFDYIQSLNSCEDPYKYDKSNFDLQTTQCQDFMAARFSYSSCVAIHGDDPDFSENRWRIFLGRSMEMWASQNETITLYDSRGLIVDRISY
ncbi:MAG: hypothetical protein KGI79_01825 [Patescibacteria group bacterium]|nr:hypothetical protein [Patescibacteria group bacterium]MDE2116590.1 hypothetical protein [Patescibacteria group bacterium]